MGAAMAATEQPPIEPLAASQQLLHIARRQAQALDTEDFATYQLLADERDVLQRVLERPVPNHQREPVLRVLRDVAELDRNNVALVRRLIHETGQLLQQIRQGQGALQGYARPGAHLTVAVANRLDATG